MESSLHVFSDMEGFEDLNSSDDSSLVALLDDLQDETLLTLLNDDLFVRDLCENPFETAGQEYVYSDPGNEESLVQEVPCQEPAYYRDKPICTSTSIEDDKEVSGVVGGSKRDRTDTVCGSVQKRLKLDHQSTNSRDVALANVMHDHCYTSVNEDCNSLCQSNSNSDEETSNEEGSSSDTGYDTMSSSTSPGGAHKLSSKSSGQTSHSPTVVLPPTTRPHLPPRVDPVVLIEERIKHYMCSREVNLTEEEKEILKAEGLPIPTTLPLTKVEEKALKNVRRKIRNRVAAQESRKRKKELMQTLEDRVSDYNHENTYLKKRVEALEAENKSLIKQLAKLQAMVSNGNSHARTKVGTCVMVIILCFAVFFGGSTPTFWSSPKHAEYATTSVRSRSLLSVTQEMNFHVRACDWFKQIFMREEFDDVELNRSDNQLATRNTLSMHIAPDIAATNISIDDSDSRHLHRRSQLA